MFFFKESARNLKNLNLKIYKFQYGYRYDINYIINIEIFNLFRCPSHHLYFINLKRAKFKFKNPEL